MAAKQLPMRQWKCVAGGMLWSQNRPRNVFGGPLIVFDRQKYFFWLPLWVGIDDPSFHLVSGGAIRWNQVAAWSWSANMFQNWRHEAE